MVLVMGSRERGSAPGERTIWGSYIGSAGEIQRGGEGYA